MRFRESRTALIKVPNSQQLPRFNQPRLSNSVSSTKLSVRKFEVRRFAGQKVYGVACFDLITHAWYHHVWGYHACGAGRSGIPRLPSFVPAVHASRRCRVTILRRMRSRLFCSKPDVLDTGLAGHCNVCIIRSLSLLWHEHQRISASGPSRMRQLVTSSAARRPEYGADPSSFEE